MRLSIRTAAALFLAIPGPAWAGQIFYDAYLSGNHNRALVLKIDTREMNQNQVLESPQFSVILTDQAGRKFQKYFRAPTLRPGRVIAVNAIHGIQDPRQMEIPNLSWGTRLKGGKADDILEARVDTSASASAADPPEAIKQHCANYTRIAIQQFNQNSANQCGFRGNRWQANTSVHFGWCVQVPVEESNGETTQRANAITKCMKDKAQRARAKAESTAVVK